MPCDATEISCSQKAEQKGCQSCKHTCLRMLDCLQTVRSKLAERVGMGAEAGCSAPMEVAEAAFASGKHQRLLRSSIASIVGPSSRYIHLPCIHGLASPHCNPSARLEHDALLGIATRLSSGGI